MIIIRRKLQKLYNCIKFIKKVSFQILVNLLVLKECFVLESIIKEVSNIINYIRYWLFEKIGEIYTRETARIADVLFFNELIDAWTFINAGILKKTCNPDRIKDVKLNELKNRIFSYIYFKNIVNIKNVIASGKKADCDKYLTYLNSFKEVHDGYKNEHCEKSGVPSLNGTDYFSCNDKGELASLINKLEECKSAEKPNPETQSSSKFNDYNKCIKCKRFAGYSNHKYIKFIRFNKFNRSSESRKINTSSD
ncbi:CYIR protein [Plasmodium cynomolgi strain B]|uniref:CYIR protein n=1 Tax=Plasmodium cynomolgi (strain B) TaxID=1120755 RepID=K6UNV5_PLACD|nr:CYIR protein [Plasmodium cynomolgi strain B]GAB69838.1 CYIR protein [Plasmodium cynomolgi strain B]